MKTIVIGLGNPILGDDGVGWRVAEQVEKLLQRDDASVPPNNREGKRYFTEHIEIDCLAVGGLTLMEHLIGYYRAILIDAMTSGKVPLGTVSCFPLDDLPNLAIGHLSSAHDTTVQNAIQVGRSLGAQLPDQIDVVAIEAQQVYDFSEELSPPVAAAVPKAIEIVMELLK